MASILKVNEIQDRNGNNAIGVDDISYGRSKAWIRFENDGTINNDFNVNSVIDNGTGDYTVNFTDPMPNSNYCFDGSGGDGYGSGGSATSIAPYGTTSRTTTSCRFYSKQTSVGAKDMASVLVIWWGD